MQFARTDLVLVASVLTMIAAAFSVGLGYNAIYQYTQYTAFSPDAQAEFLGLLIFGIPDIIASVIALAGGNIYAKKKSYYIFSIRGYHSTGFDSCHFHDCLSIHVPCRAGSIVYGKRVTC
jgi:hypothetical protein